MSLSQLRIFWAASLLAATVAGCSGSNAEKLASISVGDVNATSNSFNNQALWTFVVGLQADATEDVQDRARTEDVWVEVVYLSAIEDTLATEDELRELADQLVWNALGEDATFAVENTSADVDGVEYHCAREDLRMKYTDADDAGDLSQVTCYAMLLAPKDESKRWRLGGENPVVFPIQGYSLDRLTELFGPNASYKPPTRGVALVRLYGVDPSDPAGAARPLSHPLYLKLEGGSP